MFEAYKYLQHLFSVVVTNTQTSVSSLVFLFAFFLCAALVYLSASHKNSIQRINIKEEAKIKTMSSAAINTAGTIHLMLQYLLNSERVRIGTAKIQKKCKWLTIKETLESVKIRRTLELKVL